MKIKVDKNLCIGCGACQAIEPTVFEIEDDGLAKATENEINDDIKENVMDALEGCPTSAISEISDNDLTKVTDNNINDDNK